MHMEYISIKTFYLKLVSTGILPKFAMHSLVTMLLLSYRGRIV